MQTKLCDLRKIVLLERFSFTHERLNLARGPNTGQYKKSLGIHLVTLKVQGLNLAWLD